jgi:hypothetical protein
VFPALTRSQLIHWPYGPDEELRAAAYSLPSADKLEAVGTEVGNDRRQVVLQIMVVQEATGLLSIDVHVQEEPGGRSWQRFDCGC